MAKPAGKDKTYVPPRKQRAGTGRPTSPLLQGREQDVALIDQLLERIDQGGSTLVISGEPGIGKSALLEVAKHRANERDIFVLSMTGVLAEVHLPFAALEQALRPLMNRAVGLVPRQRSALAGRFRYARRYGGTRHLSGGTRDAESSEPKARRASLSCLLQTMSSGWIRQPMTCWPLSRAGWVRIPIVLMAAMRDGFNRSFGDTSTLAAPAFRTRRCRCRALAGRPRTGPLGRTAQPLPQRGLR